jgi:hypothetical protein
LSTVERLDVWRKKTAAAIAAIAAAVYKDPESFDRLFGHTPYDDHVSTMDTARAHSCRSGTEQREGNSHGGEQAFAATYCTEQLENNHSSLFGWKLRPPK